MAPRISSLQTEASAAGQKVVPRERFQFFAVAGFAIACIGMMWHSGRNEITGMRRTLWMSQALGSERKNKFPSGASVAASNDRGSFTVVRQFSISALGLIPFSAGCEKQSDQELAFAKGVSHYEAGELAESGKEFQQIAHTSGELGVYSKFALANLNVLESTKGSVSTSEAQRLLEDAIRRYREFLESSSEQTAWKDDARHNLELAKQMLSALRSSPNAKQESKLNPNDSTKEQQKGEEDSGDPVTDAKKELSNKEKSPKKLETKKDQGKVPSRMRAPHLPIPVK